MNSSLLDESSSSFDQQSRSVCFLVQRTGLMKAAYCDSTDSTDSTDAIEYHYICERSEYAQ